MKPPTRWIGNLALLTLFGLSSCVAGETAARWLFADSIVLFPRYHTGAQYGEYHLRRLRPRFSFHHTSVDGRWGFRTNGQGFRDTREYKYDKRPGSFRVIALGDSHTEGFECRQDHTYSQVLERTLKRAGLDAEVMNTGISGFSTAEALAFLEAEGLRYQPDAVVLGFFANDFEDNLKVPLYALQGDHLTVESREHVPGVRVLDALNAFSPLRWASENSYLYSALMNTVWDRAKAALLSDARAKLQTEFAVPTETTSGYAELLATKLIDRIHELCRARGIIFVLLDVPTVDPQDVFRSSIPANLVEQFRAASDVFVSSEDLLAPYRGIAETHLPHGHRHISEFSHLMIGKKAGEEILRVERGRTAAPP
jgi:lysophospholipase L1-like esterase